ncbi:MAG: hypothetical protein IJV69_01695 [Kiritimatiellae bacterium]|nr:hypothetical protein [Kiritimatiellia bacterium]
MKKALRILWKVVLSVLILLAVILLFVLCGGLGPTVTFAAPKVAKHFGADVSLEKCVILPLGGYIRIEGLRVENPEAFRTQNAKVYADSALAQLGKLELDFAMRSLFGKEYVVDKIELTGVRALYAFDFGTTNVDALMAQLKLPEPAPAEPEAAPAQPAEFPDIRLAYVHLEDNSVTIRKFVNVPVVLPPMTLTDTDSRTLKEKIQDLVAPVTKVVSGVGDTLGKTTEMIGDGLGKTTESLGEGLGKTTEALGSGLGATKETLSDSAKAIGDSAEEAVKNLKGLFKKK